MRGKKKVTKKAELSEVVKVLAQLDNKSDEPRRSISLRVDGQLYDKAKERLGSRMGLVFESALREALQALEDEKKAK